MLNHIILLVPALNVVIVLDEQLKQKLYELYVVEKLTIREISHRLNMPYETIRRKLIRYSIPLRPRGHQRGKKRKPYERVKLPSSKPSDVEKAYMIGLSLADLYVFKPKNHVNKLLIRLSTTKYCMIKLMDEVFGKYCKKRLREEKKGFKGKALVYEALVRYDVFSFLLNKKYPTWVENSGDRFFSFLAGLFDGDGHVNIRKDGRIAIGISMKNLNILQRIVIMLNAYNIKAKIYHCRSKDYYNLEINERKSCIKLAKKLVKYSKHGERLKKLKQIANVGLR